ANDSKIHSCWNVFIYLKQYAQKRDALSGGRSDPGDRRQMEASRAAVAAVEWSAAIQRIARNRDRDQPEGADKQFARVDGVRPDRARFRPSVRSDQARQGTDAYV